MEIYNNRINREFNNTLNIVILYLNNDCFKTNLINYNYNTVL